MLRQTGSLVIRQGFVNDASSHLSHQGVLNRPTETFAFVTSLPRVNVTECCDRLEVAGVRDWGCNLVNRDSRGKASPWRGGLPSVSCGVHPLTSPQNQRPAILPLQFTPNQPASHSFHNTTHSLTDLLNNYVKHPISFSPEWFSVNQNWSNWVSRWRTSRQYVFISLEEH